MKKTKGLLVEFKQFISRGNVIDMAVGVIIATSFTAIVNSLVKEIIMPSVGHLIGGIDFTSLKIVLTPAANDAPEVAILYGSFINQVINFIIIAFVIFSVVKVINRFRTKKEAEVSAPVISEEVVLLTEIRDLLKK